MSGACALAYLKVDVAALQETRLQANATLLEKDYTFYWQGRAEREVRLHGVGFAVRNSLLSTIQPPTVGTERILSLRLSTSTGFVKSYYTYNSNYTYYTNYSYYSYHSY